MYDRKKRIKDEPRPLAQDSGASVESEQVGEPLLYDKGSVKP